MSKNTCFINVGNMGMGDFLFCVCLSIYLKNTYENIYILYSAVHFNGIMYIVNRLFEENNVTNITCIGNSIYKDENYKPLSNNFVYSDEISSEIYDKFNLYKEEIEVDEDNNIYIFVNNRPIVRAPGANGRSGFPKSRGLAASIRRGTASWAGPR